MKLASIAFAASAALASPLSLAGNMSLTIQGITGPIEVLAFSFNAVNPSTIGTGGGGAGAGKVTFSDFSFLATESATSPRLFTFVATGMHSQSARLSVLNPDSGQPHSEWVLTDVLVTSFGIQNGDAAPKAKQPNTYAAPATAFGLAFAKACYRIFAADGSVAREACWDVVSNTPT